MIPAPPPPPEALPATVVAIVVQVPDLRGEQGGVITSKEFDHTLTQVAARHERRVVPKPGGKGYEGLKHIAIEELLDESWIRGQAAEMGVGVRPRQVTRLIAKIKRQVFENEAQYRRFLKEAHYTKRDMVERAEVQILTEHISANIAPGLRGKAAQKVFSKFAAEFETRWRSQTVCASGYVTKSCSNGPEPAGA